jgi:hypothetical protein
MNGETPTGDSFRVLVITQALWGERIAANIKERAPTEWTVDSLSVPLPLPPVIDDPDEFLPASLPQVDLLLALGEIPGLAQLIPDLVRRTRAMAVIAPIDHTSALPHGLQAQVTAWLEPMDVPIVFPKPFCSLTLHTTGVLARETGYDDSVIRRFAASFGRPEFRIQVEDGRIADVAVTRDSACGCAHHIAERLVGTPVDEAVEATGMLHHHFPCLASMAQDPDYGDTLMHVSGHLVRDAVRGELSEHLTPVPYLRPDGLSELPREEG